MAKKASGQKRGVRKLWHAARFSKTREKQIAVEGLVHGSHRGGDTLGPLHCLLSDNPGKLDKLTEPAGQPHLSLLRCTVVIGIFCVWVLPLPAPSLDLARPVRRAASSDPQRIDSDNATSRMAQMWPRALQ